MKKRPGENVAMPWLQMKVSGTQTCNSKGKSLAPQPSLTALLLGLALLQVLSKISRFPPSKITK